MGLNIKNPKTCELIAELARLTGDSKTAAIQKAVEAAIMNVANSNQKLSKSERIMEIARKSAKNIQENNLVFAGDDELYDEFGLPK